MGLPQVLQFSLLYCLKNVSSQACNGRPAMAPKTVGPKFVEPSINSLGHTRPSQDYKTKSFSLVTIARTHPCSTLIALLPMEVSLQCICCVLNVKCEQIFHLFLSISRNNMVDWM